MAGIDEFMLADTTELKCSAAMDTVTSLENQETTLALVVGSIGVYLLEEDKTRQAKGIEYLSLVLSELDRSFLSRHDIQLVATYLCSRIETPYAPGAGESARGLRALSGMDRFMREDAPTILKKIFSMAPEFSGYSPATRREVYKLLESLMSKYRTTIIDNGDFIQGFLGLIQLEKDPRSLVLVFPMIHTLLKEWDISDAIKNLWEAIICYFPVTFRPPENGPIGITPEDLKLHLRTCMAGTSSFAPLAFPYLIQKLDELATANTKRDVMQTMSACVDAYSFDAVSDSSLQIWEALRFEVLNATEDSLAEEALTAIGGIVTRLSCDSLTLQMPQGRPLFRFVTAIVEECTAYFRKPQHKQVRQASRVIEKVALASSIASHLVVKAALPRLIAMHQDTDLLDEKKELLEVFNQILNAAIQYATPEDSLTLSSLTIQENAIEKPQDENTYPAALKSLTEIFLLALDSIAGQDLPTGEITGQDLLIGDSPIGVAAVKGLQALVQLPGLLTESETSKIVQKVAELTLRCSDDCNLKIVTIAALRKIGEVNYMAVTQTGFQVFLRSLPAIMAPVANIRKAASTLKTMAAVAVDEVLFVNFFSDMFYKLADVRNSCAHMGVQTEYTRVILCAVLFCVTTRSLAGPDVTRLPPDLEGRNQQPQWSKNQGSIRFLHRMLCALVSAPISRMDPPERGRRCIELKEWIVNIEEEMEQVEFEVPDILSLTLIGRISLLYLREMTVEQQQEFAADEMFALFVDPPDPDNFWQDREVLTTMDKADITATMLDLMLDRTQTQWGTLPLTVYLAAGLHPEVRLNFEPNCVCAAIIRSYAYGTEYPVDTHEAMLGIMGLLYNKWGRATPLLTEHPHSLPIDAIKDLMLTLGSFEGENLIRAIDAVAIFTKVANLKGDRYTTDLLHLFIGHLGHAIRGPIVAAAFRFILAPSEILCKENHLIMRPYYQQPPFAISLPRILELFKKTDDDMVKNNCIVAMSGILKWTPPEIFLPEINNLMPLLLHGLIMPGYDANVTSIKVVNTAIVKSPASVEAHIRGIIDRLSDPARSHPDDPDFWISPVRSKAYECLGVIPECFESSVVVPYKFDVLRHLEIAVNNQPRELRDEAAACRSVWFHLEEPSEDDI